MKIYPAIDLIGGRCVRLSQGDFDSKKIYSQDPFGVAREFQEEGAEYLHVVDLDGAKAGGPQQTDLIRDLVRSVSLKVQVGGGVRNFEHVAGLLEAGVERVVIGSLAVKDFGAVESILDSFGADRVTLAFDVLVDATGPRVATHGWQDSQAISLWEILERYREHSACRVLCTDIGRDGMLEGPNETLYRQMRERSAFSIQASGGVSQLSDLKELRSCGVESVIVGKALYEKRFTLKEALRC